MDDETYFFHQTPSDCAKELITFLDISSNDILYEPFKGEGAFFNNFPQENPKVWAEIREGVDYKEITEFDWAISNPPFKLDTGNKKVNSFYFLCDYFMSKARKGVAFLANDACFGTLTPNRLKAINDKGWFLQKIVVCSIKKWRGRYFFIVFQKKPCNFYNFCLTNF